MSSPSTSGWPAPRSLAAGFPASRYRLIGGLALEVLPRLADGAYDMVFCDADPQEYADYLAAALRLLRPGGIVAFDDALARPADGAGRQRRRRASCGELVRSDERLVPLLLPIGNGLLDRGQARLACSAPLARRSTGSPARASRSSSRTPNPVAPLDSSPAFSDERPARRCPGAPTAARRRTRAGRAPP